ncbi:class I SAM-dependent methyltransferase [Desulforegula conservatrix]|uniref:class I SAM-dependent methyltransferase n=1 Tax=Desulforegula conservatrix TaxID=153026 RepID=UPI0003FE0238|nr:class I SAM-dependent methyltransferase [Desulforegula conservatrix]
MQDKDHWERVYSFTAANKVSWFQEHAELSLKLIQETGSSLSAAIIDVGGGVSTLVDGLLAIGYEDLTVLDLSGAALAAAKRRLASRSSIVKWIEANIIEVSLPENVYDIWHDRAVFHFLTEHEARMAYINKVMHAVKPGGHVIVATFAENGPTMCSGLPVMRYSSDELHAEFGKPFKLLRHEKESHITPGGIVQEFVYCYCCKEVC